MVQFLSINFFSCFSSIFVGFSKFPVFLCHPILVSRSSCSEWKWCPSDHVSVRDLEERKTERDLKIKEVMLQYKLNLENKNIYNKRVAGIAQSTD